MTISTTRLMLCAPHMALFFALHQSMSDRTADDFDVARTVRQKEDLDTLWIGWGVGSLQACKMTFLFSISQSICLLLHVCVLKSHVNMKMQQQ